MRTTEKMEKIKLQKFFSDMGIMSRRAAEVEISQGKVKVNGEVASLGDRIDPAADTVEYRGKRIVFREPEKIYVMLNKPRGYVTTLSDEKGRPTVTSLVKVGGARLYPIGRLDMDSDGLLLLTNDGDLTNTLTHPKHEIPKIYHVTVRGKVTPEDIRRLSSEMEIDGYNILPVKTEVIESDDKHSVLRMTLFEGRNRQIRKMCDTVGLVITRLSRVAIGSLELHDLPDGKWRFLSADEISYLKGNRHTSH